MKNQIKGKKGITLIALVITIIVLLILAGVTIATLTGDNGLLQKAQTMKDKNKISKIIEQIKLDIAENQLNNFGNLDNDDFYEILEKYGTISYTDGTLITNEGNYSILISDIYENGFDKECWRGKNAVFVGDSITYGIGTTEGSRYWEFLKDELNFSSVSAMGIAGSCISSKSDYGTSNTPLVNRYNNIPKADLISIFMGTNDYGHETPLGSIDDITDVSFYGALNVIIPELKQKYSTSRIVFITPLHRYGFGTSKIKGEAFSYDNIENGVGCKLEDYVNAIKDVCKKYSIDVIDLYKLGENDLNPSNPTIRESYFPDGLHPNSEGHKMVANILQKSLCLIKPIKNDNSNSTDLDNEMSVTYGNLYIGSYVNNMDRASVKKNIYLKLGDEISLKNNTTYKYGVYSQTSEEIIESQDSLTGWITNTFTAPSDGWYGIAFARCDNANFNFNNVDSSVMWDYININKALTDVATGIKLRQGNFYSPGYVNSTNRASIEKNVYLKSGDVLSLKNNATYKYGVYSQNDEIVSGNDNLLTNGWISTTYTIPRDGWYGIAFARYDNANFNFNNMDPSVMENYLNIN